MTSHQYWKYNPEYMIHEQTSQPDEQKSEAYLRDYYALQRQSRPGGLSTEDYLKRSGEIRQRYGLTRDQAKQIVDKDQDRLERIIFADIARREAQLGRSRGRGPSYYGGRPGMNRFGRGDFATGGPGPSLNHLPNNSQSS